MPNINKGHVCAVLAMLFAGTPSAHADEAEFDEVTVTSERRERALQSHSGNIGGLAGDTVAAVSHQHIHELLTRTPGTWISRGSGQESLPAVRSPVLTGAGSCGGFLILEDGIPTRPSAFCNVNQLFEVGSEFAGRIEVVRGPGTALYGSNALHGIVNVLNPLPGTNNASLEFGANDFRRARTTLSNDNSLLSVVHADDGGFRDDSGYRQSKLHASTSFDLSGSDLRIAFSATDLDQETAGFIVGEDAYRDPLVNRSNPNPEAFRRADSQRLYAVWTLEESEIELRPFLRRNEMRFLQHFLPGQPLEENGHVSAGLIASKSLRFRNAQLLVGFDLEWADTYLRQTQSGPTQGSAFLQETRPEGRHYDYDADSLLAAPWLHSEISVSDNLSVDIGLRAEYVDYDYRNNLLDGNTRDDGTVCGFGGCLYSRPADRSDSFTNLAPKVGMSYALSSRTTVFARLARGFRAPQLTELYRLQNGQSAADLDSERVDSIELGWRHSGDDIYAEIAAFAMRKRGSVLRDADGFNVSNGRSRHSGVEASVDWPLSNLLRLKTNVSYARHTYDFDLVAARGETFVSGNDVDTAPRWLGSLELLLTPLDTLELALQWSAIGDYFIDAENRFSYPGHDLVNLRAGVDIGERFTVTARLNNVLDDDYADRADFAFGNFRYFPGRGRELFIELRYQQ